MNSSTQRGAGKSGAPLASSRSAVIADAAQLLQAKHRKSRGQFLLEGLQGVREALAEPDVVLRLFASASAADAHADLLDTAHHSGVPITVCDDTGIRRIATAVTPLGLVALCQASSVGLMEVLGGARLVVYLHKVSDPGNLGTIIRTADAAGVDAVVLSPECVDPYNDKALRSTAGSIIHVPVLRDVAPEDAIAAGRKSGLAVLATAAHGASLASDAVADRLGGATMWIFGSEAHGLPADVIGAADTCVSVPLFGRAESLNVSVAAAVCVYASAMAQRQH